MENNTNEKNKNETLNSNVGGDNKNTGVVASAKVETTVPNTQATPTEEELAVKKAEEDATIAAKTAEEEEETKKAEEAKKVEEEVKKKAEEEVAAKADETKFESAELEITKYAVLNEKGAVIKLFDKTVHGDKFKELAKKYVARKKEAGIILTAKEHVTVEEVEEADTEVVNIVTKNNQPVRTFSKKVHGDSYVELANKFVGKYGKRKGYKVQ